MTRISVLLSEDEREALFKMARRELRAVPDQARYIIRGALLGESPPQRGQQPTKNTSAMVIEAERAGVTQ